MIRIKGQVLDKQRTKVLGEGKEYFSFVGAFLCELQALNVRH